MGIFQALLLGLLLHILPGDLTHTHDLNYNPALEPSLKLATLSESEDGLIQFCT